MADGEDIGSSALRSISEGAGLFLLGRASKRGLGLLTNLVLTRGLGTRQYGMYSYFVIVAALAQVFTRLGADKSMLRYLPEYEDNLRMQNAMLTIACLTSVGASVIVAIILYWFAPLISRFTIDDPLFIEVIRVGAIVLPFNTLSKTLLAVFKAIDRMDYNVATSSVAQPLFRLLFVGGAVVIGYSVVGAIAGFVVAGILTFLTALIILVERTDLGRIEQPSRLEAKQYYDFSAPLTFTQLGSFFYNRIDLLMVGILLSSAAVGIYRVGILVAGVLALPLMAFNQLFPPIASRLYQRGNINELKSVYSVVTRWIFTISLFPGIGAILYSSEVLAVFGEDFSKGAFILTLFTFAQLTNCLVGPGGYLLMMTDHQYLTMVNQLSSGGLNAIFNYVLIVTYGLPGAAVATATVLAGINVARVLQIWYLEGFFPYDLSYAKPLLAGAVSAGVMASVSGFASGYVLIVVGGVLGAGGFAAALAAFGLEEEEKDILRELLSS
jgi:O-antigen/teichoic acid export membrane protein